MARFVKTHGVGLGVGGLVAIALILFCVAPLKTAPYTAKVPYQTTETYYVTESYEVQEPYQKREPYEASEPRIRRDSGSTVLLDDKYSVSAGHYKWLTAPISLHTNDEIEGVVVEETGHDIDFYVFDQKGFNAWRADQGYTPYVYDSRVNRKAFSFTPDHSDTYYFVMDNAYSWVTPKVVDLHVEWHWVEEEQWYETVTKYRTVTEYRTVTKHRQVPKQRTVTKYREETRYKKVSPLEYLLHY